MNHMEQVAEMLGVKFEERFKITEYDDIWHFNEYGLKFEIDNSVDRLGEPEYDTDVVLREILQGEVEIIKFPWKPSCGKWYWVIRFNRTESEASPTTWSGDWIDYAAYASGNCFKTKAEAEAAIPWYKENIERIKRGEKWQVEKC